MKVLKIVDNQLRTALNSLMGEPMPIKTAQKLKTITNIIIEQYQQYEEVRIATVTKFGSKNEDGSLKANEDGTAVFEDEATVEFTKIINELLSTDVEIPTIKFSELGDKVTITASNLFILNDIIVED